MTEAGPRELDVAWRVDHYARSVAFIGVLVAVYLVGLGTGFLERWIAVCGLVVFAGFLLYGVVTLLRLRRDPMLLHLDQRGLTVRGHPGVIAWSDVAEVRVRTLRPPLRLPVVAFVGRAGVELPRIASPGQPRLPWSRSVTRRLHGTQLVVATTSTTVGVDALLTAVTELGGVPVDDRRG